MDLDSLTILVFHKSYLPAIFSPAVLSTILSPPAAQTPEYPVPGPLAALVLTDWLKTLCWIQWIQQTGSFLDRLHTLVEIPTGTNALSLKASHQHLEFDLLALHELLDGYL